VAAACQWGLGLPLAVLAGPVLGLGLGAVWASQVLWRLVQALVLAAIWRSRSWSSVAV
jgi:Na+-driven multidrug efflux pump